MGSVNINPSYNLQYTKYEGEPLPLPIKAALNVLKEKHENTSISHVPKNLEEKAIQVLQNFTSWPQRIWRALTFQSTFFSKNDIQAIKNFRVTKGSETSEFPSSEKEALRSFYLDSREILGTALPRATLKEERLIQTMSQRIWDSANVQEKEDDEAKYKEYTHLMAEFFRGSHFICELKEEESNQDSSWLQLFSGNQSEAPQGTEYTGTKHFGTRVSSHYVNKLGEQFHFHLRGKAIPETVFADVRLAINQDGSIIYGKRVDQLSDSQRAEVTNDKKFVWIQTENNPDGPDWTSYLKHRTIDFVIYKFRKHILNSETPNVGHYGYGVGDMQPIVLKLAEKDKS